MTQTSTPLTLSPTLLAGDEGQLASGARPLLLAGPSLGTSTQALWSPSLVHLAETFTVVGWDLPGHGRSAPSEAPFSIEDLADGVESMLQRLTAEHGLPASTPVIAAGVSIAGAVSLALALRKDTRMDRLAAICTAASIGTPEAWLERAELVDRAGTPTMVEGSAQRWFAPGFLDQHPDIVTDLLHSLQQTDRHSYAHACHALSGHDLTEELGRLARPLLVINGAEDGVCPPVEAERIAAASTSVGSGARVRAEILGGVGHLAPAEAPRETARLLKEFLHD